MSQHPLGPFHTMTLLAFTFLAAFAWQATAATGARLSESYGKLPLHFEANRGQAHKDVRFLSRGPGYSLYLTSSEAVLVLSRPDADAKRDARSTPVRAEVPSAHAKSVALRMSLVGAAHKPVVSGLEEQPGKANYFIGKDPAKWRTRVSIYAKVAIARSIPASTSSTTATSANWNTTSSSHLERTRTGSCSVSRARTKWRSMLKTV